MSSVPHMQKKGEDESDEDWAAAQSEDEAEESEGEIEDVDGIIQTGDEDAAARDALRMIAAAQKRTKRDDSEPPVSACHQVCWRRLICTYLIVYCGWRLTSSGLGKHLLQ